MPLPEDVVASHESLQLVSLELPTEREGHTSTVWSQVVFAPQAKKWLGVVSLPMKEAQISSCTLQARPQGLGLGASTAAHGKASSMQMTDLGADNHHPSSINCYADVAGQHPGFNR